MKYEYKIQIKSRLQPLSEKELNEFGVNNWELISVITTISNGFTEYIHYHFKRVLKDLKSPEFLSVKKI